MVNYRKLEEHSQTISWNSHPHIQVQFNVYEGESKEYVEQYKEIYSDDIFMEFYHALIENEQIKTLLTAKGWAPHSINLVIGGSERHYEGYYSPTYSKLSRRCYIPEFNVDPEDTTNYIVIWLPKRPIVGEPLRAENNAVCDMARDVVDGFLHAVIHELGHHLHSVRGDNAFQGELKAEFEKLPGDVLVSKYAGKDDRERLCETLVVFLLHENEFRALHPEFHQQFKAFYDTHLIKQQ